MFLLMPVTDIRLGLRWPRFIQTEQLSHSFFVAWTGQINAIGYAKFYSRSRDAVIQVYDEAGKLIEVHRHKGDFKNYDRL